MSQLNPIIGSTCMETLHNAACVASFLARLQLDRSDGLYLAEEGAGHHPPDTLSANETLGLYFITEALAAALRFEAEGRQVEEGRS